jgi:hypothetical protein
VFYQNNITYFKTIKSQTKDLTSYLVDPDDSSIQSLHIGAKRSSVQPSPGQLRRRDPCNDPALEEDAAPVGDHLPGIGVEVDCGNFSSLNLYYSRSSETLKNYYFTSTWKTSNKLNFIEQSSLTTYVLHIVIHLMQ